MTTSNKVEPQENNNENQIIKSLDLSFTSKIEKAIKIIIENTCLDFDDIRFKTMLNYLLN